MMKTEFLNCILVEDCGGIVIVIAKMEVVLERSCIGSLDDSFVHGKENQESS